MSDWISDLERITQLHKSGALSEDEFAVQKSQILGRARESSRPSEVRHEIDATHGSLNTSSKWILGLLSAVVLGLLIWIFTSAGIHDGSSQLKADKFSAAGPNAQQASTVVNSPQQPNAVANPPIATPTINAGNSPSQAEPVITYNPSFRCVSGQSNVLNMICRNRELSEKDRRLSAMYKLIISEIPISDREASITNQRRLLYERSMCADVYCISSWYDRVIALYEPYMN